MSYYYNKLFKGESKVNTNSIPPNHMYGYYFLMVAPEIRKTRCIHCERGYEFKANPNPTGMHNLYVCIVPHKCGVHDRIVKAAQLAAKKSVAASK